MFLRFLKHSSAVYSADTERQRERERVSEFWVFGSTYLLVSFCPERGRERESDNRKRKMGVRYIQFYVYGLLSTNVMRLSKQKILM